MTSAIKFCIVVLILSQALPALAQQRHYNNWYFGHKAGLNFNTTPPTPLGDGQLDTQEGTASISDSAGNLLFYTDGVTVWDRHHTIMPHGTGLTGHTSSSQSALIVPMPGSGSKYYLFTVTDHNGPGTVNYSIVDMTMNSGRGDVDPDNKNIFVTYNQTEKLVAANSTGCGTWVITHQRVTNRFEARLVTADSVAVATPVYSYTGGAHTPPPPPTYINFNNLTGMMKVSPNSRKLGLATLGGIVEVFDFDPATGILSNPVSLSTNALQEYGVCFSPDNSKFYVNELMTSGYKIYQYDISSGVAATISASKTLVGTVTTSVFIAADMAVGPDGKMYCARPGIPFLAVVPRPNLAAPLCGFDETGQSLGAASATGLPNEIRVPADNFPLELGPDTTLCPGDVLALQAPAATAYLWSTGATTPSIQATTTGQYWVRVSKGACRFSDTMRAVFATPQVYLGSDTTLCQGQQLALDPGTPGAGNTYTWSTGATNPFIIVTTSARYWVRVSRGTCSAADSVNVVFNDLPQVNLGNDITVCEGQQVSLSAGAAGSYLWSTGATSASITTQLAGQYWVKVFNGNCQGADTVVVNTRPLPGTPFQPNTTACRQQALTLDAGTGDRYLWSTGDTTRTIPVTTSGHFQVKVNYYGLCDKTYATDVSIKSCDCEVYVPTAFTPNNDNRNDLLRAVPASDCDFIHFVVFNRFGQKVFETADITKGWDGKLNGIMQSPGAYVWQITARKGAQNILLKGTVVLMR